MQKIKRVSLFSSKKDLTLYLFFITLLFIISLGVEYYHYQTLKRNKSEILQATIIKHYIKTTPKKRYQVIKLRFGMFHTFYTTASTKYHIYDNAKVHIKIYTKKLTFFSYLKGFYARGWFLSQTKQNTLREKLAQNITNQHTNKDISTIYKALYLAYPLDHKLYTFFSSLGVSHLFAISGFHLGLISFFLFLFLKPLLKQFYQRYFPYRDIKRDTFYLITIILLLYVILLEYPPSLVQSYSMMIIGFFLYDRGLSLFSLQTLFIAISLLLALFPPLFFSFGFWLSVLGVFYILVFLHHFQLHNIKEYFIIPFWVYLMMLPTTLFFFHNFSLFHPFSILATLIFSLFYPLSLFFHLFGYGSIFDPFIQELLSLNITTKQVELSFILWSSFMFLSFGAIFSKKLLYTLLFYSIAIFGYVYLL